MPRGAQVIPHDVSMRMAGRAGNDNSDVVAEIRALREGNAGLEREVAALRKAMSQGALEQIALLKESNETASETSRALKRVTAGM